MNTINTQVPEPVSFQDILKATNSLEKLGPDPIKEIRFGEKAYASMIKEARKDIHPKKQTQTLSVGTLFGIKVILDKTLEPNQYRIVIGR